MKQDVENIFHHYRLPSNISEVELHARAQLELDYSLNLCILVRYFDFVHRILHKLAHTADLIDTGITKRKVQTSACE